MKRNLIAAALLSAGLALLLCFPQAAAAGVIGGLTLCGTRLLPALFPYFVLTRFCAALWRFAPGERAEARMRRWFGLSGSCIPALALSFVGGYPVGVSTACALYRSGQLTKRDAERCLVVCNNSGPAFFTGVLGAGVFHSTAVGLRLYIIHVAAALLCARCLAVQERPAVRIRRSRPEPVSAARAFSDAITGSCAASLQVSAIVVVFSVILQIAQQWPALERLAPLIGFLELTSGVMQLTDSGASFLLAAFYMGWGGLCVHLQAMAFWGELRPRGYWTEKLLHGLLSVLLAAAVSRRTPGWLLSAAAAGVLCIFFPKLRKKRAGNLQKSTL